MFNLINAYKITAKSIQILRHTKREALEY